MKIKKLITFGNTELTNASQDLYTLLTKNDKFKYATASQKLTLSSFFVVILHFSSHRFLFYYLISNSHAQETSCLYFEFLLCNALHSAGNRHWWRFLEYCFYCYYQEIIFTVINESLISYNLIKRAPEKQLLTL